MKNTQNTANASLLGYDGFCDDCGNECEHCTCSESTDMNQLAQAIQEAYQQYCEAYNSLTTTSEEIEVLWQVYNNLREQALEEHFGKEA